jgi:hypothetical protein
MSATQRLTVFLSSILAALVGWLIGSGLAALLGWA